MATGPQSARPRLACEVTADRVIAARAADHQPLVETYTARALPPGVLTPALAAGNVAEPEALRQAIAAALETVGGRSRDLIAVLPDAAVRVVLLDFDSLPERGPEAAAVVRFRLRKALPFDVERAALSYHVEKAETGLRLVAAVAPREVISEYESAFRDAGYVPGVVLPSMLAALGPVEGEHPTMVIKVDATTVSVAIVDRGALRLLRTLENPAGAAIGGPQLAADVYPSVVFFEDTYGAQVETVLLAGLASLPAVADALQGQTGIRPQELVTGRYLGAGFAGELAPRPLLAGVVGALVG